MSKHEEQYLLRLIEDAVAAAGGLAITREEAEAILLGQSVEEIALSDADVAGMLARFNQSVDEQERLNVPAESYSFAAYSNLRLSGFIVASNRKVASQEKTAGGAKACIPWSAVLDAHAAQAIAWAGDHVDITSIISPTGAIYAANVDERESGGEGRIRITLSTGSGSGAKKARAVLKRGESWAEFTGDPLPSEMQNVFVSVEVVFE